MFSLNSTIETAIGEAHFAGRSLIMKTIRKGIRELYAADPERADWVVFGRRSNPLSRRGFLSGLGAMSTMLGAEVVFGQFMPAGLMPAALAEEVAQFAIEGKHPGLIVLNDRPVNVETPAYLLDDKVTPADRLFVRNNGIVPVDVAPERWSLTIDGESVVEPVSFSLAQLKARFKHYSYQLTLECGGNGRAEFNS